MRRAARTYLIPGNPPRNETFTIGEEVEVPKFHLRGRIACFGLFFVTIEVGDPPHTLSLHPSELSHAQTSPISRALP